MTVQMEKIKAADQADAIHMMWVLIQELESKVDGTDDLFGRRHVEAGYRMWNRITGDDKVAAWDRRTADTLRSMRPGEVSGTWVTLQEGPDDGDGFTVDCNPKFSGVYRVQCVATNDRFVARFARNEGGRTVQWHNVQTDEAIIFGRVGDMWLDPTT